MKFHVFAGYYHYPCGGSLDHINTFDTKEEALVFVRVECKSFQWWHICESEWLSIVEENE